MFVPDRLKTNAYRVLRLPADATVSEIHKAAGSMRRAVSLGVATTTEGDMPLLGEMSRTETDIRAAIGRLENPTQRLSDRLFWFHLAPESRDTKAQAAVDARLSRLRLGNFGDCEPVGEGVLELRIHYGPGYRVYFAKTEQTIVLLLIGGAKKTQVRDIKTAKMFWREHTGRVPNERKLQKL